jgi:hypothetical protein
VKEVYCDGIYNQLDINETATINQFSLIIRELVANDADTGPHAILTGVCPNKQGHSTATRQNPHKLPHYKSYG